ncbi:23S rRNA (guanosine-2'-O-)-methyltransferase RlmB [Candidatus Karelsulcia muelleri]|nr:23S rRNA (guanosine-2'-O-)-methyltransferase RlmB [Candidatus Karelsulcia muelleri]
MILENLEKPGNIGAILRTASAIGVDAVFFCDEKIDLYNPNIVRSSLGSVFNNNIAISNTKSIISWLKKKQIKIFPTSVRESAQRLYNINFKNIPLAIVIGQEKKGLSKVWFKEASDIIQIPIKNKYIDSLNVSNATAIILFEIYRQKCFT